jgi:hypothetical protein
MSSAASRFLFGRRALGIAYLQELLAGSAPIFNAGDALMFR